jgi:hypothetical protein
MKKLPVKDKNASDQKSSIIIYKTDDGRTKIDVSIDEETVWLTQEQMAGLFEKGRSTITEHISNIFKESELEEISVCREFRRTGTDNKEYNVKYYNLDVIISVGYRVKSLRGTQFRIWATQRLKEYIIKGFTIDDDRLKQGGSGNRYFEELLQRIRDIRSSERNFYQKVTDIFTTSVDYKIDAKLTKEFFATIQNKIHFAVHGQTAAEVIFNRANSSKTLMGLTNFKGNYLTHNDIEIAKNYLNEDEINQLNLIVSLYLDFAELQATNKVPMTMMEWVNKLDEFLKLAGKKLLKNQGVVSHQKAINKAKTEFNKFTKDANLNYLSDFDKYINKIESIKKQGTK